MRINIPKGKKQSIVDAFCSIYGYRDEIEDNTLGAGDMIPNPQTKEQFAKEQVLIFIKNIHSQHEVDKIEAARKSATINSKSFTDDITIT